MGKEGSRNGIFSQFAVSQLKRLHITHIYMLILTESTPLNTSMITDPLFGGVCGSQCLNAFVPEN